MVFVMQTTTVYANNEIDIKLEAIFLRLELSNFGVNVSYNY